jgi:ABC-2 type transport system ATP-binding protein
LNGKVWQWIIPSTELPALKQKHIISGTVRRSEGIQVRVVGDSLPAPDAQAIPPTLEDVYLYLVSSNGTKQ